MKRYILKGCVKTAHPLFLHKAPIFPSPSFAIVFNIKKLCAKLLNKALPHLIYTILETQKTLYDFNRLF